MKIWKGLTPASPRPDGRVAQRSSIAAPVGPRCSCGLSASQRFARPGPPRVMPATNRLLTNKVDVLSCLLTELRWEFSQFR
jgi:hypothetical protein